MRKSYPGNLGGLVNGDNGDSENMRGTGSGYDLSGHRVLKQEGDTPHTQAFLVQCNSFPLYFYFLFGILLLGQESPSKQTHGMQRG